MGTGTSTLNSAKAISKYSSLSKEVSIINVCGEDKHEEEIKNNGVNIIKLNFSYFKYLPKKGFLQSRFSYVLIFILSFIPLTKLLYKNRPDYLIIHLITSLPLIINYLFRFKSKIILRISGFPKLNILRKVFWSITTKKFLK